MQCILKIVNLFIILRKKIQCYGRKLFYFTFGDSYNFNSNFLKKYSFMFYLLHLKKSVSQKNEFIFFLQN